MNDKPAKTIREWRASRFLTLKEFADLVGVRFTSVYNWEHARTRPTYRNVRAIAAALGIEPAQIILLDVEPGKERPAAA